MEAKHTVKKHVASGYLIIKPFIEEFRTQIGVLSDGVSNFFKVGF
jgi:hypothetical protein